MLRAVEVEKRAGDEEDKIMTIQRPRRRSSPISKNALDSIKRKALLEIELSVESLLHSEKALDSLRKATVLTDASDEVSRELADLVARASEDVDGARWEVSP